MSSNPKTIGYLLINQLHKGRILFARRPEQATLSSHAKLLLASDTLPGAAWRG